MLEEIISVREQQFQIHPSGSNREALFKECIIKKGRKILEVEIWVKMVQRW